MEFIYDILGERDYIINVKDDEIIINFSFMLFKKKNFIELKSIRQKIEIDNQMLSTMYYKIINLTNEVEQLKQENMKLKLKANDYDQCIDEVNRLKHHSKKLEVRMNLCDMNIDKNLQKIKGEKIYLNINISNGCCSSKC